MTWLPLTAATITELDIQKIFDDWGHARSGWRTAGVPQWLDALGQPDGRRPVPCYGYSFTPDALWREHRVVAELKAAAKYEPLALAEVLHHAQHYFEETGAPFKAVMITSENAWLRRALCWLFERGTPELRSSLRFLECTALEFRRDGDRNLVLWADDRFAGWRPDEPPVNVPLPRATVPVSWRRVDDDGAWICLPGSVSSTERPLFDEGPVAMLSHVTRGDRSTNDEYVFWHGSAPKAGTGKHPTTSSAYQGRCWFWDGHAGDNGSGPPTLLPQA